MPKIMINLSQEEIHALNQKARLERREIRKQAAYYVRKALIRDKMLDPKKGLDRDAKHTV